MVSVGGNLEGELGDYMRAHALRLSPRTANTTFFTSQSSCHHSWLKLRFVIFFSHGERMKSSPSCKEPEKSKKVCARRTRAAYNMATVATVAQTPDRNACQTPKLWPLWRKPRIEMHVRHPNYDTMILAGTLQQGANGGKPKHT